MMLRMEHANLSVREIDESVRFLQAAFPEFELRGEGMNDDHRWLHIGTDDTYIALYEATKQRREPYMSFDGQPGINHLGFEVDDVDALRKRLTAAGYKDSTYPNDHPHRKRAYFFDADGNDWEFVEYFTSNVAERNDYALPD